VKQIKALAYWAARVGWYAWVEHAARVYGVTVTTIRRIMAGKTWVDARPTGWKGRFYNVTMKRRK